MTYRVESGSKKAVRPLLSTILQSLDDPVDDPKSPDNGQEKEPPPEDEENLVVDHVEGEDTDGVLTRLTSAKSSKSDVVASGDLGEDLAHRVEGGVE